MFAKIEVNGANAHPLFQYLKHVRSGILGVFGIEAIQWNFTKFLVDAEGKTVKRFAPSTKPASLREEIYKLLPKR
jgi:glutathione peroxidase